MVQDIHCSGGDEESFSILDEKQTGKEYKYLPIMAAVYFLRQSFVASLLHFTFLESC